MASRKRFQYQVKTDPLVPINNEDKWHQRWSEPVRQKISAGLAVALIAASGLSAPVFTPPAGPTAIENTTLSSQVQFNQWIIYQSHTAPVLVPEVVTVDKWNYAWSEPVRIKRQLPAGEQQTYTAPAFTPEVITPDKWIYPWSEPVRQKAGLDVRLQQSLIAPVLSDRQLTDTFESRWHYPWSEPVRTRQLAAAQQQALAQQEPSFEIITIDKWVYPWVEPVRQKPGLRPSQQQDFIGVVLDDETQIIQGYESRWHYAWSEPVRVRPQVPAGEQQTYTSPVFTPEIITPDKWIYPWSEPVRQKQGLKTHLQQAFIAPVLEPNSQITQTYESRWHQPWSEPVRFRRFPTAEQQALAQQEPSFEIITIDKWGYAWSEPVRQKPGLRAHLQQAFIATTLDSDTQITQTYESRWHYAWSEPVRFRTLATAQQQFLAAPVLSAFEIITLDKWVYPWTEPVRQKQGLLASLQQALAAPVLDPDTQLTTFFESRWHYAWSEPVRTRIFPTAEQQAFTAPPTSVFELVTVDKWIYPWRDPVRFRIDPQRAIALAAPFIAGPVLNPNTQIIQNFESRWHYPWSEPVRLKPGLRAHLHPPFAAGPVLDPNTQIIQKFESRFHYPWSEPVRLKIGLRPYLQQTLANPLPAPPVPFGITSTEGSDVIFKRRFIYQSHTQDTVVIPTTRIGTWFYPWSEPVRKKPGLGTWLQQTTSLATPPFPNFVKTIPWFAPLNEPKRFKEWLHVSRMPFFWTTPEAILGDVFVTLNATETNTDSALFGITVYNLPSPPVVSFARTVVSIGEIKAIRAADISTEEVKAHDDAAVSVKET